MKTINIEQFVNDYLETASWVECDSDECTDFTKEAIETAKSDCESFIFQVIASFGEEKGKEILTTEGNDFGYLVAHDLYLTRNGHGTGFWDRDEIYGGMNSAILTRLSESLGSSNAYHVRGKKSKLTFE